MDYILHSRTPCTSIFLHPHLSTCQDYSSNYHLLFECLSDETLILKITPPPALHIMLGIFNHIWKGIENISDYHKNTCHDFAVKPHYIKESYWGKTFEGNECQTFE